MTHRVYILSLLVIAETLSMALWFSSSAVLGDMIQESSISGLRQAMLASGVQLGFAAGAIIYAIAGLADRYDPRYVFAISAMLAAFANAGLLLLPIGSGFSIVMRILTGAFLAGVYPVGMKIAIGWGKQDRGLLIGLLVGALTLGSAAPYLLSFMGGTDWRLAVGGASGLAFIGSLLILFTQTGPFHATARKFELTGLRLAWHNRQIRYAIAGYLGHMWELYAFWAWIAAALALSFKAHMPSEAAIASAKLTAFAAIGTGAIACVAAGLTADRIGKANTTIIAMMGSGGAALLAALAFGGPPVLIIIIVCIWGAFVIADSAQFSALIADHAPPEHAGSLLTLQTALGFALTIFTVQATPWLADFVGWRVVFLILAIGPAFGIIMMWHLLKITKSEESEEQ